MDYHPEDFYEWALEPCVPLFETVAPASGPQNFKTTLQDFLDPEVLHYSLCAVNGKLSLVERDGRGGGMMPPGFRLDDSVFPSAWPSFLPTQIELCPRNSEDVVFVHPKKVLVDDKTIKTVCFLRIYEDSDSKIALREIKKYKQISESTLDRDVRINRLLRIVKDDENRLIGLLLTYIDCGFVTLTCALGRDIPVAAKQKWADQVTNTLARSHEAEIVWGDAKTDNVLIDRNNDAWIIDFGGGYTRGFVEKEKAGIMEGGLQGLKKIVEYVTKKTIITISEDILED